MSNIEHAGVCGQTSSDLSKEVSPVRSYTTSNFSQPVSLPFNLGGGVKISTCFSVLERLTCLYSNLPSGASKREMNSGSRYLILSARLYLFLLHERCRRLDRVSVGLKFRLCTSDTRPIAHLCEQTVMSFDSESVSVETAYLGPLMFLVQQVLCQLPRDGSSSAFRQTSAIFRISAHQELVLPTALPVLQMEHSWLTNSLARALTSVIERSR